MSAKLTQVVIVREGGRSGIPETSVMESKGRGVLDTPHARGMTASLRRQMMEDKGRAIIASSARDKAIQPSRLRRDGLLRLRSQRQYEPSSPATGSAQCAAR